MAGKSFENPLLSHARMRGIYRGLVEVRGLRLVPRGLEACFVAACIDLHPGDCVFASVGPEAPAYVRRLAARTGSGKPRAASIGESSDPAGSRLAGTAADALLCAAGAATAFAAAQNEDVALAIVSGKGLDSPEWVRIARATDGADLPLVTILLPGAQAVDWGATTKRAGIPVIPVDASDAVALYRVAQECLGRARADRRGAAIECVPSKADPVSLMGEQLLAKRIANERWIQAVGDEFTKLLTAAR